MLHHTQPSGRTIGKLGDEAICETVTDQFGESYEFAGVAPRAWNGEIDVDALKPGEFILAPYLVYHRVEQADGEASGRISKFLASLLGTANR